MGRIKTITALLFGLAATVANGAEWRIFDEVGTHRGMALICHLWGVTIFAPGEKPSCMIGTLFVADLEKREIRYQNASETGLPRSRADRDLKRSVLINAMEGEGVAKLEKLRTEMLEVREKQRALAEAERARAEYLASFEGADSLAKIQAFETKYAGDDPDELIPKLASKKERLKYEEYRTAYASAKTSSDMGKFVGEYASYDPDRLVGEAKKKVGQLQKQEQVEQQRLEKQRQEEQRQKEAAARQAAADKDKNRLRYIGQLHAKYAANIVSDSDEGRRQVMGYKINCKVPDGRVLPLAHALYASIAQIDGMGGRLVFRIKSRGQQVRIYAETFKNGKMLGDPELYYQLNEWGELRPIGLTTEAVLNACVGSHGPLWVMPGEPGY